jgi:hypothetical protein
MRQGSSDPSTDEQHQAPALLAQGRLAAGQRNELRLARTIEHAGLAMCLGAGGTPAPTSLLQRSAARTR